MTTHPMRNIVYWDEFRRRFQEKRPVSAEKLGEALSIPGNMVRMFLNNHTRTIGTRTYRNAKPNLEILENICKALDLPLPEAADEILREFATRLTASGIERESEKASPSIKRRALLKLSVEELIALGLVK